MKKKLFAVLLVAILLLLSACSGNGNGGASPKPGETGKPGGGKVTLDLLHFHTRETAENSSEAKGYLAMLDKFIDEHPEYTINESTLQQADYHTKVMALAAANEMPDIFFTKGSWVQNFYDNDLMADLTDSIDTGIYREGVFIPFTRGDKIFASPIQFALTSIVYYNEEMWKDIGYDAFPATWEELIAANEKFKDKGITTIALGNKDKWPYESCIISTLGDRMTGTDWTQSIILNDGKAKFTDAEFVNTLEMSKELVPLFNIDFNAINNEQADNLYGTGKAASTIEGAWTIAYLLENAEEEIIEQTRFALLPSVNNQKGEDGTTSGGAGWAESASSKLTGEALTAAKELINATTGVEFCKFIMEDSGLLGQCEVPVVDKESLPGISQRYLDFVDTVKLVPIYDIQMDGAVIDVMNSKLQELLGGTATAEDAAAAIQAAQDKLGS